MRTVLAGSLLLIAAVLLTPGGDAGVCPSTDDDGVGGCGGGIDNCTLVPNGPLLGTGSCFAQEDGDMDGYGNPCDSDLDNDGGASLADVSIVLAASVVVSTLPATDLNCNGAADLADVSKALADAAAVLPPGPSGYACAGTIPCP
jgi:hypothetical protein